MMLITNNDYISTSALYTNGSYLSHHGVKGQKWGVRHDREKIGRIHKGSIRQMLSREIERGQRISRTKKGKRSFLKRNVGVGFKQMGRNALAAAAIFAVTAGAAALSGGNPLVVKAAATSSIIAFGSAATIANGRDKFDQIVANGAWVHNKLKK